MTLIEGGKIINTHGVNGELKIENYCDDDVFFKKIKTLYIDKKPFKILSQRCHKSFILATLEGVETVESAMALKNKTVFFDKDLVPLESGQFFISDIIGFCVFDTRILKNIGVLSRVYELPASRMLSVIDENSNEILIPYINAFVKEVKFEDKVIEICSIEGMLPNEN